jgi:hypothetical protein
MMSFDVALFKIFLLLACELFKQTATNNCFCDSYVLLFQLKDAHKLSFE